ncbi:MAG: histidine kinase [Clostridia bacterium]|nr:histidine kinase [Clostridia bacterium]
MPSIHLPYVNIALDAFALVVTIIIFVACINEYSNRKIGSKHFLFLQSAVVIALISDMVGWFGEGRPALSVMTLISNTIASCACHIAIISFMAYLIASLYANSRAARCVLTMFRVMCILSLIIFIGNSFWGYAYSVNEQGHWHRTEITGRGLVYLFFPILSFFAIILLTFFAKSSTKINRAVFFVYTLFPVAGVIIDYVFDGISLTYAGFAVSILVIYTSIYLTRQKQLEAQRNALMLSQINPHFVYNTLSTIAAMCDTSPKQAKYLTIDFSQYLRRNIGSLTSEELIPFEQEMEHVACYLKIEKARFRERLNVIYSTQCKNFSVPPLTVQPLVENAIKHGITKKANGGTIKITTFEEDTHYVIEIIDDGVGFDSEITEMHVGIQNVQNRLAATCRGTVTIKSTLGVGTRVTIEIPKKKGKRK